MMSNTNAPYGFKPTRKVPGTGMDFGMSTYYINASSTTAVYKGDVLQWDASYAGYVTQAVAGTETIVGIAQGFMWINTVQGTNPWQPYFTGNNVGAGNVSVLVIDDPNAIFQVQCGATKLQQSDVGANIQFVVGTGNTSNGLSGMYLSSPSATTSTLPFRIYNILGNSTLPSPVTDYTSAYNQIEVTFNNVSFKNSTGA